MTELVGGKIFKSGDNSTVGGNGDKLVQIVNYNLVWNRGISTRGVDVAYLDFGTTDPSNGRELVLHKQVVRLVIETPLADNQIGASVLHPDLSTLARFYDVTKKMDICLTS